MLFYNNTAAPIMNYETEEISSVYNNRINRVMNIYAPVHIFGTGSSGNSVYLKPLKTMIDLGFSKKKYYEYDEHFFDKLNYLIITHHHSDHLNPATLLHILEDYPHIKVIVPNFLKKYITSNKYKTKTLPDGSSESPWIAKFQPHIHKLTPANQMWLNLEDGTMYKFSPRTVKHGDIINIAIQIYYKPLDLRLLYSTDLDNLNGHGEFIDCFGETQAIDGLNQNVYYNMMFLEANYDKEILEFKTKTDLARAKEQFEDDVAMLKTSNLPALEISTQVRDLLQRYNKTTHNIQFRADSNLRHISEQDAFQYVQKFLTPNGIFIPMHASSSYGSLFQS